MIKEVKVPEISENVESGTVVNIIAKTGDWVEADDPIVELETDKAVVEIPTPYQGRITELLVNEGDEVNVGDVIARVDTAASATDEVSETVVKDAAPEVDAIEKPQPDEKPEAVTTEKIEPAHVPEVETGPASIEAKVPEQVPDVVETPQAPPEPVAASPSVRRFARELGVDIHEVEAGESGRITEKDVKAHVKKMRTQPAAAVPSAAAAGPAGLPRLPDFSRWGNIEKIELSTVRRITSESVATSWNIVPHVTQFDHADITNLQKFVAKAGKKVAAAGGKLTVTPVLMKACSRALIKFPNFNSSIDPSENKLIIKHFVHIGMMVDTPRGLLVPVIRDADKKSITELAVEIVDLAERARSRKIKPDELEGGTFSISNQGGIGGDGFTPIVLWPQVAILGVSRTRTEPRYIDGELQPRDILPLSMSYDHRIIDGADAARFLRWICESLEYPMAMDLD